MITRRFWIERIERAWSRRSVVWLSGVRRVGKTCLAQSLPGIEYFDCELPRVRRLIEPLTRRYREYRQARQRLVVLERELLAIAAASA